MAQATPIDLLQRPGVRQFIKFIIIGLSSTIIDVSISNYLTFYCNWNWIIAATLSFAVSVTNGYFWNSRWTFKHAAGNSPDQYIKFVAVNIVGLALNLCIMKCVFFMFTGKFIHQGTPEKMHWYIAKAVAIVLVSLWNFFINKKWTFKPATPALNDAVEQA